MIANMKNLHTAAYTPSPEAIRQMAAEIRRGWSQAERMSRVERARLYQMRLLNIHGRSSAA
jgi:hypothetical protein